MHPLKQHNASLNLRQGFKTLHLRQSHVNCAALRLRVVAFNNVQVVGQEWVLGKVNSDTSSYFLLWGQMVPLPCQCYHSVMRILCRLQAGADIIMKSYWQVRWQKIDLCRTPKTATQNTAPKRLGRDNKDSYGAKVEHDIAIPVSMLEALKVVTFLLACISLQSLY